MPHGELRRELIASLRWSRDKRPSKTRALWSCTYRTNAEHPPNTVFMKGHTPLTSRLLKPALIDAQTSKLTDSRDMSWYVKTLLLSQPLHFGDYGGLPLKILWTLLDIFTLVVLGSGLYLWWSRRKTADKRISQLEQLHLDYAVDLKDLK